MIVYHIISRNAQYIVRRAKISIFAEIIDFCVDPLNGDQVLKYRFLKQTKSFKFSIFKPFLT